MLKRLPAMSDAKEAKKDEAATVEPEADGKPGAAKGGGASKLLPALVGVNSLLLVGVLGFLVFQTLKKPAAPAPDAHDEPAAHAEAGAEEHGEKKDAEGSHEKKEEKKPEKKAEKKEDKKAEKKDAKEEHGAADKAAGHGEPGSVSGPLVKISDFVVHLRNPEMDRYARMSFDVEVIGESDKDRLNENLPKVRDAFISYLSDRTVEDLRGSEGLGRTKDALQTRLRELVPEARVRALYISDFVVQ